MSLESDVKAIRHELFRKNIEHFSTKDIVISFFGALLVGSTFIFRTGLLSISLQLKPANVAMIVLITIGVLAAEIYFIGYSKVRDKKKRPLPQFLVKRIITIYSMSILVGFLLMFLYGIDSYLGISELPEVLKVVVGVAFPASIGAILTDLLKKF